jgi:hypothetical protein
VVAQHQTAQRRAKFAPRGNIRTRKARDHAHHAQKENTLKIMPKIFLGMRRRGTAKFAKTVNTRLIQGLMNAQIVRAGIFCKTLTLKIMTVKMTVRYAIAARLLKNVLVNAKTVLQGNTQQKAVKVAELQLDSIR